MPLGAEELVGLVLAWRRSNANRVGATLAEHDGVDTPCWLGARRTGADEVEKSLYSSMPRALGVISASSVPVISKSVELLVNAAKYSVEMSLQNEVAQIKIKDFFSAKEFLIERITDKSRRTIDVRPLMVYMKHSGDKIEMLLRFGPQRTVKPDMVIQKVFGLSDDEKSNLIINRDEFFYETANGELIKQ